MTKVLEYVTSENFRKYIFKISVKQKTNQIN